MTKDFARRLQRDFIPDGGEVKMSTLRFRTTTDDEIFQCCAKVGYDPQSTYLYCGEISDFVALAGPGKVVALCSKHRPPAHLMTSDPIITLENENIEIALPPS